VLRFFRVWPHWHIELPRVLVTAQGAQLFVCGAICDRSSSPRSMSQVFPRIIQ
jgi:hypothetical protein